MGGKTKADPWSRKPTQGWGLWASRLMKIAHLLLSFRLDFTLDLEMRLPLSIPTRQTWIYSINTDTNYLWTLCSLQQTPMYWVVVRIIMTVQKTYFAPGLYKMENPISSLLLKKQKYNFFWQITTKRLQTTT